eukprot:TRINITY_DN65952_c0_g1_i1.p1 TRINITY_DN65952_c0_g1~~TRINITY_DN65952_c0_g1_i1.p1  ORF type:complete len:202 (+),score=38.30 TRINITY_DN65952_c0_g1_i1:86-607(+)
MAVGSLVGGYCTRNALWVIIAGAALSATVLVFADAGALLAPRTGDQILFGALVFLPVAAAVSQLLYRFFTDADSPHRAPDSSGGRDARRALTFFLAGLALAGIGAALGGVSAAAEIPAVAVAGAALALAALAVWAVGAVLCSTAPCPRARWWVLYSGVLWVLVTVILIGRVVP